MPLTSITQEINAAYEILGDPDKRAIYDDFGHDHQGFEAHWQYENANIRQSSDFYNGDSLIHKLTDQNFDERLRGKGHWFVEFYAPWCVHCQHSTDVWRQAASRMDGEVEFGAINGVYNQGLMGKFQIKAYPTMILFSPEHRAQAQYNWRGGPESSPDNIAAWARGIVKEWDTLFSHTSVTYLTQEVFDTEVMAAEDAWVVMYTKRGCIKCSDSTANWYESLLSAFLG